MALIPKKFWVRRACHFRTRRGVRFAGVSKEPFVIATGKACIQGDPDKDQLMTIEVMRLDESSFEKNALDSIEQMSLIECFGGGHRSASA